MAGSPRSTTTTRPRSSAGRDHTGNVDGTRSARTTCAFCGSALIDERADASEPVDRVVRFTVDAPGASSRIGGCLQGHWFAPDAVRRAGKPDELRGVTAPFWAFDAVARTSFGVRIGLYWYRTETYTETVNGKTETKTRQVRETEWFGLSRAARGRGQRARAVRPRRVGAVRPALVAGLVAERPTVPRSEAGTVASQELARREQDVIGRTQHGAHLGTGPVLS